VNSRRIYITRATAGLVAALLLLVTVGVASAAQPNPEAAGKALAWVKTQQQADGSFAGFGAGSTVDAALAIVAAGGDPAAYTNNGNSAVEFLQSKAADLAKTPGGAGKLLIAVSAMGLNGKSFGGVNLVELINASYDPAKGQYGEDAIGHAFAMLGLRAAGETVPAEAVAFLERSQTPEGGWAFTGEATAGAADTNTTAVAVQALHAMGAGLNSSQVIEKALGYLRSQQGEDGGFPYQKGGEFGSESDVNSTAYVLQALLAMRANAEADRASLYLLSMQKPSGAFQWKKSEPDDNAGATYQAIPALLGRTLADPRGPAVTPLPPLIPGYESIGMPRTGGGLPTAIPALAVLAMLALAAGFAGRRTTTSYEKN
jgi:hypothetical protein